MLQYLRFWLTPLTYFLSRGTEPGSMDTSGPLEPLYQCQGYSQLKFNGKMKSVFSKKVSKDQKCQTHPPLFASAYHNFLQLLLVFTFSNVLNLSQIFFLCQIAIALHWCSQSLMVRPFVGVIIRWYSHLLVHSFKSGSIGFKPKLLWIQINAFH